MARHFSNKLEEIIHFCRGRRELTIAEYLVQLGTSGPAIFSLLFSIPFLFLAWIPIVMTVFGIIIFLAGARLALNKPIWFPAVLRNKKISGDKMALRLVKWVKLFKKVEKIVHPRGTIYQKSPFLQAFNGFIVTICGLFLFLPLHPVTIFLPALGVFLLSLAILEEDLFLMIGAYLVLVIKLLLLFLPVVL